MLSEVGYPLGQSRCSLSGKKIIICFLLLIINYSLLITNYSLSQSGWIRVTDSIPDLNIMSMQFTSPSTGYVVGSYGTVCP
jgi:hypothetical protein